MARNFEYHHSPSGAVSSRRKSVSQDSNHAVAPTRSRIILGVIYLFLFGVVARLFYWQVIHRTRLQAEAENQYQRTITNVGKRGKIFTSDGYLLVTNAPVYRLYAEPQNLKQTPIELSQTLAPLLVDITPEIATQPAVIAEQRQELQGTILARLSTPGRKWIALKQKVTEEQKRTIETLSLKGLGFEEYFVRDYPEASTAAHIVGFVGKNQTGEDQGYFGIEGALDKELRGQADQQTFNKDALGFHLFFDELEETPVSDGRDVVLTIRRDIQHTVEEALKNGIEKYGAVSGSVVVMEPKTGKILAMAAYPNYEPEFFYKYPPTTHKNPIVADTFEPGSIFKVLTVSGGVDKGVINPQTVCPVCNHARQIGSYTIRTWNDVYTPNITIGEALAKSDNTAMIYIAELLGQSSFIEYLKQFGIGEATHIELQEDTNTPFRKDWKVIDLATGSFGQGIATTGMQMVKAVGAIANGGKLMRPTIIEKVIDHQKNAEIPVEPTEERQVITEETANTVSGMMEYAAQHGEAQWISSKSYSVAGKTGTAQIPIDGQYAEDKTIASFIGFSPVEDPQFVMLVTLRETKSSPWAAETAAPLWYGIANRLYLLLNIPADR